MKLLILSHEYPPVGGGGANACMNLAREYGRAGHIVKIVTVWYEGQDEVTIEGNVTIYRVRAKRKNVEHCNFVEMLDYLLKSKVLIDDLMGEEDFDICQVFFGIPSGPLGYYLKRRYRLPYIIRFGGGDIPGFQERYSIVYRMIGFAIKLIWNKAETLVANSEGLRQLALAFYDKKEIIVIPNGTDIRAFSESDDVNTIREKDTERDASNIKLLFVSRLIERKGLQDVLPLLKDIQSRCKQIGMNIELSVVGDGPFAEKLKSIVKEEKLTEIVIFHGQKSKSELPEFYSNADIFIFPSKKEGMPNVVLEAMSYGLPIVMTPCEGSEELIHDNGFVCSIDEFTDRIIKLIQSKELRMQMGENSIKLVRESFSWKRVGEEYLDIFDDVINRNK